MPGRIRPIPLQLVRRNFDLGANLDKRTVAWFVRAIVGDPAEGLAVAGIVVIAQ
jgi:hypothetical protein